MEIFSELLAIEFPTHKDQWRGALVFSLICAWINGWVNNREAGDLRLYRALHDVTAIMKCSMQYQFAVWYLQETLNRSSLGALLLWTARISFIFILLSTSCYIGLTWLIGIRHFLSAHSHKNSLARNTQRGRYFKITGCKEHDKTRGRGQWLAWRHYTISCTSAELSSNVFCSMNLIYNTWSEIMLLNLLPRLLWSVG